MLDTRNITFLISFQLSVEWKQNNLMKLLNHISHVDIIFFNNYSLESRSSIHQST